MNKIDIKENYIYQLDNELLSILLLDRTTGKNIIWATDNYAHRGEGYLSDDHIEVVAITGYHGAVIKPRTEKSKREQLSRVRDKAEVFTPSWICNKQNNLIDAAWFGRVRVFNTERGNTWSTRQKPVAFPSKDGKTWQDYVCANRMEVSCGEAPYLVSRYDTVTGAVIPVKKRIGLLDRKLRVVCENVDSEPEWYAWAKKAIMSVYGFDWQGDNVLLARENLLFTFSDWYIEKFGPAPIKEYLKEIATILSWNIWQMDGLKFVVPNSCKPVPKMQITFFDDDQTTEECPGCLHHDPDAHTGAYCKIKDWDTGEIILFKDLTKEEKA